MFSKKKVVPVVQRSRFAKAKPKIVPKGLQSKNEKEPVKNVEEDKGSELSPNKNVTQDNNVSESNKSPSKSNHSESGVELPSSSIDTDRALGDFVDNSTDNCRGENFNKVSATLVEVPVRDDRPLSVMSKQASSDETLRSPIKVSSFKEIYNFLEDEPNRLSPNKNTSSELVEITVTNPSPVKASVVTTTDKSLKYPCLTKILAAPKKRPQNKEMNERKKKMATYMELPPRNEMTFTDLIYWNPNTEPMKKKEKKLTVFSPIERESEEERVDDVDEDEETSIAPKLFVNENGEIIVDETSLVKERKKTFVDMKSEAIILDDSEVTYATFRKKVSKKWSPKETVNFYKALSVIGTDFALMESIIPNRTRRELKIKFKKEEKLNMELLHRAMYETDTFQSELSVEGLDLEVIDIPGLEECIADEAERLSGKKPRRRKYQVLSEIENNEGANENESQPVKKGRGRPKGRKKVDKNSSLPELADDSSVDSSPIVRKKRVTTLLRDSIDSFDDRIEDNESSSMVKKINSRVLSQDSQENIDEYCEIQVQINSMANNEDNQNVNVEMNVCVESTINPEESPTENIGSTTSAYVRLEKMPIPDELVTLARQNPRYLEPTCDSVEAAPALLDILSIKKEKLGLSSVSLKTESCSPANKQTSPDPLIYESSGSLTNLKSTYQRGRRLNVIPNVELQKSNNADSAVSMCTSSDGMLDILSIKKEKSPKFSDPSESSAETVSAKATYRRGRKLNIKPNVRLPKSRNAETVKIERSPLLSDPESLAVIHILDNQVLSEGATDVVTTPAVSRRQKNKKATGDDQNIKRTLPSALSYTPVIEPETEPPDDGHRSSQRSYSRSPVKKRLVCESLSSESVPVSEHSYAVHSSMLASACSSKFATSSPLVTTLNTSSNRIVSIPVTPEMGGEAVMVVNPSPDGKSYHFFMSNNFTGNTPLPPEIPVPPTTARFSPND